MASFRESVFKQNTSSGPFGNHPEHFTTIQFIQDRYSWIPTATNICSSLHFRGSSNRHWKMTIFTLELDNSTSHFQQVYDFKFSFLGTQTLAKVFCCTLNTLKVVKINSIFIGQETTKPRTCISSAAIQCSLLCCDLWEDCIDLVKFLHFC